MTYREGLFTEKKAVLNHQGKAVKPRKDGPVEWAECWEVETAHYHVTCHVSSARTHFYGMLCEALFVAFNDLYQPETITPYKMEIHIFNKFEDFQSSAASIGIPVAFGTGGFFSPSLLCIFAYEDSIKVNPQFTPEKVLGHELSHQFLHLACNGTRHVPTWVNEGLAVYFETFALKRGKYINKPPTGRIQLLSRLYQQTNNVLWPMKNYSNTTGISPVRTTAKFMPWCISGFLVPEKRQNAFCRILECPQRR